MNDHNESDIQLAAADLVVAWLAAINRGQGPHSAYQQATDKIGLTPAGTILLTMIETPFGAERDQTRTVLIDTSEKLGLPILRTLAMTFDEIPGPETSQYLTHLAELTADNAYRLRY